MSWDKPAKDSVRLSDAATARAKLKGIGYGDAYTEICREQPDLYARARDAVLGHSLRPESLTCAENPASRDHRDAGTTFAEIVQRRAREKGISFRAALTEVAMESPELAHAAREAVLGRRV